MCQMCCNTLLCAGCLCFFFFSSRRRHTRLQGDWSSDVCSSDLVRAQATIGGDRARRIHGKVQHRREVEVAAHCGKLRCHGLRRALHQRWVVHQAELGWRRPRREGFLQRVACATFLVDTDQDRSPCCLLNLLRQGTQPFESLKVAMKDSNARKALLQEHPQFIGQGSAFKSQQESFEHRTCERTSHVRFAFSTRRHLL